MWQLLVAAAVAGSGFLARRLIFGTNGDPIKGHYIFKHKEEKVVEQREEQEEEEKEDVEVVKPSSFPIFSGSVERCDFGRSEGQSSVAEEEGIFRFCSLSGGGFRSKSKGLSGKRDGVKRIVEVQKDGNKLDSENADEMTVVLNNLKKKNKNKNKKGGKLSVCLKKRRTGKNASGNCESCCSEGSSHLSWGIGVGLMCMISAGKAEINKLNVAIDEAKEVINDLKYKLYKGKLFLRDSSFENRCSEESMGHKQLEIIFSDAKVANLADTKVSGHQFIDDCEYASSVLTEEPEPQVPEIDQLEAELEFELQKISCDVPEEPYNLRGEKLNLGEVDQDYLVYVKNAGLSGGPLGSHENLSKDCNFFQFHGVSPYELDRKLCSLLIKQQESQIMDLQSKLQSTQIKLCDREAELLSLKNCVRHFRDLSLEINSDEETVDATELDMEIGRDNNSDLLAPCRMLFDSGSSRVTSGQRVVVGVKRPMEIEPFNIDVNDEGC